MKSADEVVWQLPKRACPSTRRSHFYFIIIYFL